MTDETRPSFRLDIETLRDHWQGHRRVTRRVIVAFPEEQLFQFSLGGMRPFGAMALEMISMASAGIRGLATGDWREAGALDHHTGASAATTRAALLQQWDETTARIDTLWPAIPPRRFEEIDTAFGQYEGVLYAILFYWIDNEIHHRGQGYVYLRALGIEPPPFYDRS